MLITARDARKLVKKDGGDNVYNPIREKLESALSYNIMNAASAGKSEIKLSDIFGKLSEGLNWLYKDGGKPYELSPDGICKYAGSLLTDAGYDVCVALTEGSMPELRINWGEYNTPREEV